MSNLYEALQVRHMSWQSLDAKHRSRDCLGARKNGFPGFYPARTPKTVQLATSIQPIQPLHISPPLRPFKPIGLHSLI